MKLHEEDFHPIEIEDKVIFDRIFKKYPIQHS